MDSSRRWDLLLLGPSGWVESLERCTCTPRDDSLGSLPPGGIYDITRLGGGGVGLTAGKARLLVVLQGSRVIPSPGRGSGWARDPGEVGHSAARLTSAGPAGTTRSRQRARRRLLDAV